MVLDHDDGGQESARPAAMAMSNDAVPTIPYRRPTARKNAT
jgi:hypothetical protein